MSRVLVISDLHAPYHHPNALRFIRKVKRKNRIDTVIHIGDEIDAHAWSAYASDVSSLGANDEYDYARATIKELESICPIMRVCNSNHTQRHLRLARVPGAFFRPMRQILGVGRGWRWADNWVVDGVRYNHGESFRSAQAPRDAALDTRGPCVIGHLHTVAGVTYHATSHSTIWGMAVGCLIDPNAGAFNYARHNRAQPILGCGVVIDGVPRFVPLDSEV